MGKLLGDTLVEKDALQKKMANEVVLRSKTDQVNDF